MANDKYLTTITEGLSDIWSLRQRGKRDADRHQQKIKQVVKQSLKDIISSEDIISTDSKGRKIKISMKHLEQWRFKHGKNRKGRGVGQGLQGAKSGDPLGRDAEQGDSGPGNQAGELVYEEFSLDEVIEFMLEDLQLPWLEEKPDQSEIETSSIVYEDIAKKGLMPNIDIRRTLKENIKRNAALGIPKVGNFKQDDLRFKTYDQKKEHHSNAAVYMLMDRSGSMTKEKKYIAKSFFFWLVQFIKKKYCKVELVFIAHDTEATICDEKTFFEMSNSGGTICSSAFKKAKEHMSEYHHSERWNNYVFAFSDGDNWQGDNELCVDIVNELLPSVNAIGYGEINTDAVFNGEDVPTQSTLQTVFNSQISSSKFMSIAINKKEDIYSCLRSFFGLKSEGRTK